MTIIVHFIDPKTGKEYLCADRAQFCGMASENPPIAKLNKKVHKICYVKSRNYDIYLATSGNVCIGEALWKHIHYCTKLMKYLNLRESIKNIFLHKWEERSDLSAAIFIIVKNIKTGEIQRERLIINLGSEKFGICWKPVNTKINVLGTGIKTFATKYKSLDPELRTKNRIKRIIKKMDLKHDSAGMGVDTVRIM